MYFYKRFRAVQMDIILFYKCKQIREALYRLIYFLKTKAMKNALISRYAHGMYKKELKIATATCFYVKCLPQKKTVFLCQSLFWGVFPCFVF